MRACTVAALFLALAAGRTFPEAILVNVTEVAAGQPVPAPQPANEGVMDGLFEAGHIVFDTGAPGVDYSQQELRQAAAAGGARYLLDAHVTYQKTAISDGLTSISAEGRFSLFATGSGMRLGERIVYDTNKGRERDVDMQMLGMELGGLIAAESAKLIDGGALPSAEGAQRK